MIETSGPDWRPPLFTVVAMLLTVLAAQAIAPTASGPILGAVLAMTLSRSRLSASWRGRVEGAVLLPVIALAIGAVSGLLITAPWVGALAFIVAMSGAIWLRRYGSNGSRVGGLLSLPFLSLLIVPGGAAGLQPWQAAAIAMTALTVVSVVRVLAESARLLEARAEPDPAMAPPPSSLRPVASTRMALQMALALATAFLLGVWVFPGHVTWVVLSAFVVCSGNRGRADVLHKSGLRLLGATAGTLVSTPMGQQAIAAPLLVALLLVIVGLGLWLREITYAAWAFAMTLVVALLQDRIAPGLAGAGAMPLLGGRLLAILAGAACGVLASWFLLPVRSEPVVRRRLADVLAALQAYMQEATDAHEAAVREALLRLEEIAPPWRAWDRMLRLRRSSAAPAEWITLARDCATLAKSRPHRRHSARPVLGEARRALKSPQAIRPALQALRDHLDRA